jgi:hypothetical protein
MGNRGFAIRVLAVGAGVFILVLLGVRFAAVPAFEQGPDHVRIVVTNVQPLSSGTTTLVIFDQQFAQKASAIYRQLTSGTDVTGKPLSCPAEPRYSPYYRYTLTFSHGGITVATATDDARGCGVFSVEYLDGSTAYIFWASGHQTCFWDYLHEQVNAPEPINLDTGTLCDAESELRSASSLFWTED